eukprot:m51a1_g4063 hypothetical protein (435) ;mRNA; r:741672-743166
MQSCHVAAVLVLGAVACGCALAADASDISAYFATARPYVYSGARPSAAPAGCAIAGVSAVTRHGSRTPTADRMAGLSTLELLLRKYEPDLREPWMAEWVSRYSLATEGTLTRRGASELLEIGRRFAQNYPRVVSPYSPNTVVSTCTYKPRTAQTAAAFGLGALGGLDAWLDGPWVATSESLSLDRELTFYNICPRYNTTVKNNAETYRERNQMAATAYAAIAKKLQARVGIPASVLAGTKAVAWMWDACTWDWTVHNVTGQGWCSVFDESDASDLEYIADLESYYDRGHGTALAWQIAAPLLQSIVAHLDDVAARGPDAAPRARLRFAHAETVMPLMAMLGLYKDKTPLLASWTAQQREARLWRTSRISTMASSVAFVLATCSGGRPPLVQVLHNEAPVSLPVSGCESQAWCPLSSLKSAYRSALSINFDSICF